MSFTNLFQELKFNARNHTYTYKGKKLRGVTTFTEGYHKPFNANQIAKIVAEKRGTTPAKIKKEWQGKRQLGTRVHKFMEKLLGNKALIEEMPQTVRRYENPIRNFYYKYIHSKNLYPEYQEWKVFDTELNLAGTVDFFGIDRQENGYRIIDWKTNSNFTTENSWDNLYPPFDAYEDCLLNSYSLQLSAYRLIIERATGKELLTPWIVHFDEGDQVYNIYEAIDFRDLLHVELLKKDGGF